jgi:hypothetical protein
MNPLKEAKAEKPGDVFWVFNENEK